MTSLIYDPSFPQIAQVLQSDVMLKLFQDLWLSSTDTEASNIKIASCQVGEKRYKPGKNFMLTYTLELHNEATQANYEQLVTAKLNPVHSDPLKLTGYLDNSILLSTGLPPVCYLAEVDMMLWSFPYDNQLVYLPEILDTTTLCSFFTEQLSGLGLALTEVIRTVQADILHYLPEQSCMIRYTLDIVDTKLNEVSEGRQIFIYGKNYRDDSGAHVFAIMSQLAGQTDHCAKPLHYDAATRTLWQGHVSGKPFEWHSSPDNQLIAKVAACIADFHSCHIDSADQYDLPKINQQLHAACDSATIASPLLGKEVKVIVDDLLQLQSQLNWQSMRCAPLHLDLKMGNLLVAEDKVYLIDMDCVSLGDPSVDTGSFIANLYLNGLRAGASVSAIDTLVAVFISAYKEAVVWDVDTAKLDWYIAAALIHEVLRRSIRQQSDERIKHNQSIINVSQQYAARCRELIGND